MVSSPVISVMRFGVHFEERWAHCSRPLSSVESGALPRSEARNDRWTAVSGSSVSRNWRRCPAVCSLLLYRMTTLTGASIASLRSGRAAAR
jgi:hypothetical protein